MDGEEPRADVEEALSKEEEPMETAPSIDQSSDGQHQGGAGAMTTDLPKAPEDNDDDVVLVEGPPAHSEGGTQPPTPSSTPTPVEALAAAKTTDCVESATTATASSKAPTPPSSAAAAASAAAVTTALKTQSEPIVIDDEEDSEHRGSSSSSLVDNQARGVLSSTEPDSEIKIASVTTLGVTSEVAMSTSTGTPVAPCAQEDLTLKITSVTSLKGDDEAGSGMEEVETAENGLLISSAFSLNPEAQQSQGSTGRPSPTFNPGRVSSAAQPVQNGETGTHQRSGNAYAYFILCCLCFMHALFLCLSHSFTSLF